MLDTERERARETQLARETERECARGGGGCKWAAKAWKYGQLMERKNARDNANEQHNMQLGKDETGQALVERGTGGAARAAPEHSWL